MYLVGDFSDRGWFQGCGLMKVKKTITREDLAKTRDGWNVFNLEDLTYFSLEENAWIEIDREV